MENLFALGFPDLDFLVESIDQRSRDDEERDIAMLNDIFAFFRYPDRLELNPPSAKAEDVHGIDGKFTRGKLSNYSFDTKHHKSMYNTGLVEVQILRRKLGDKFGWGLGWGIRGAASYVIWWTGDEECSIFPMGNLREVLFRELNSVGISPQMINPADRSDTETLVAWAKQDGKKAPGHLIFGSRTDKHGDTYEQVSVFVRLDDIQDVASFHYPTFADVLKQREADRKWKEDAPKRAEEKFKADMEKAERRSKIIFRELQEMLAMPWNNFETGYFKWSYPPKAIIFTQPRYHRNIGIRFSSPKFRTILGQKYIGMLPNEDKLRRMVRKAGEYIGTMTRAALPKTMEKLRSNLSRMGLMRGDGDLRETMRDLAKWASVNPDLWDELAERGMLPKEEADGPETP